MSHGPKPKPAIDRFMALIKKTDDDHWMWTGGTTGGKEGGGYGVFKDENGRSVRAHRWSYKHFKGPIPLGHLVRHECDITGCVRPECLITGTHKQNQQDMINRGRLGRRSEQARINGRRNLTGDREPLTFEKAAKIRSLYATGEYSQHSLAITYKTSQTMISRIVRDRSFVS